MTGFDHVVAEALRGRAEYPRPGQWPYEDAVGCGILDGDNASSNSQKHPFLNYLLYSVRDPQSGNQGFIFRSEKCSHVSMKKKRQSGRSLCPKCVSICRQMSRRFYQAKIVREKPPHRNEPISHISRSPGRSRQRMKDLSAQVKSLRQMYKNEAIRRRVESGVSIEVDQQDILDEAIIEADGLLTTTEDGDTMELLMEKQETSFASQIWKDQVENAKKKLKGQSPKSRR